MTVRRVHKKAMSNYTVYNVWLTWTISILDVYKDRC